MNKKIKIGCPKKKFMTFEEARRYARNLNLDGYVKWVKWVRSDKRPKNMPTNPYMQYGEKFKGYKDFLGTKYTRYNTARFYATISKASIRKHWTKAGLKKLGISKPFNIPLTVPYIYPDNWNGIKDFLGTKPMPYRKLKKLVHSLNLKTGRQYLEHFRSNPIKGVKLRPEEIYSQWNGWKKFLGTNVIRDRTT